MKPMKSQNDLMTSCPYVHMTPLNQIVESLEQIIKEAYKWNKFVETLEFTFDKVEIEKIQ